jgi:hypothetical protein
MVDDAGEVELYDAHNAAATALSQLSSKGL